MAAPLLWLELVVVALALPVHRVLALSVLTGVEATPRWAPAPSPLMTRWSKDVSPELVPEYPRPMLVRPASTWAHLNGLWEIDVNATDLQSPPFGMQLAQNILVPFPVEAPLSGLRQLPPFFTMWYRRMLPRHDCGTGRTLLHFEAVDWNTTVYVNGKLVGNHIGGYDDFTFDISQALTSANHSNELLVGVIDPTAGVKGKQRRSAMTDPHGITYTSSSGIWGTVWLECVPSLASIEDVVPVSLDDLSGFSIEVLVRNQHPASQHHAVQVTLHGSDTRGCADTSRLQAVAQAGPTIIKLQLAPHCRKLWSPKQPYLYNLTISLVDKSASATIDSVASYAGLRTYTVGDDGTGTVRPLLNGKFVYQMATLDQGFWPDGNYAAPTDAALRSDLEAHKQLGFNAVRKHQKVETRRWYYHADMLGILVWQDMPCCADDTFPHQLSNVVRKRRMHPSIVQWETFNEGGGMSTSDFVGEMVALVNRLDPSRPVDSASGGRDLCHQPPIQWQSCGKYGNFTDVHHYPEPASPGVNGKGAKVGLLSAGGANASANGTEGTLVRHCDSVGYAHRVNGAKLSDAAFFIAPALNGDSRQAAMSLMSTNEEGAWLGIDPQKGNRLVLMGGKISAGDRNAGTFLKVPPIAQTVDMAKNNSFSLQSLIRHGATSKASPLYVTQYFDSPPTVGCGGCVAPNGAAPSPSHKYGQCVGDYVGARDAGDIPDKRLAVWSLLPISPAEPPPNNWTARVNGEYGGIALDPGNLNPPHPEWAPGKCRGYGSKGSSGLLTQTFADYSHDIAQLRDAHGLSASVYTQLTDCETECNGMLTYDRIMKPDAAKIKVANDALTIEPTF